MSLDLEKREITPAELLSMPDAERFDLVDGELVERNVSVQSSLVEMNIGTSLSVHCNATKVAVVFGSNLGYQCFPDAPNKVRRPDVSAVLSKRFRAELLEDGYMTLRPDLAVEVVSPNDTAYEVAEKVEEYLEAQIPLVWVVYPESRIVEVHRPDGSVTKFHEDAELTGENILPGYRCRVGTFFPDASGHSKS
jgi:Uma2 family endonuclease